MAVHQVQDMYHRSKDYWKPDEATQTQFRSGYAGYTDAELRDLCRARSLAPQLWSGKDIKLGTSILKSLDTAGAWKETFDQIRKHAVSGLNTDEVQTDVWNSNLENLKTEMNLGIAGFQLKIESWKTMVEQRRQDMINALVIADRTAATFTSFLRLPPEMRNKIYDMYLQDLPYNECHGSAFHLPPPLAEVCKTTRTELVPLFYSTFRFQIAIKDGPKDGHLSMNGRARRFMTEASPAHLKMVRHLFIVGKINMSARGVPTRNELTLRDRWSVDLATQDLPAHIQRINPFRVEGPPNRHGALTSLHHRLAANKTIEKEMKEFLDTVEQRPHGMKLESADADRLIFLYAKAELAAVYSKKT